jgi:hypothetical protein
LITFLALLFGAKAETVVQRETAVKAIQSFIVT